MLQMLSKLKENFKDYLTIAVAISTVLTFLYAAFTYHRSVEYAIRHDTYKYLSGHLSDNHAGIRRFSGDLGGVNENELDPAIEELSVFLLEAYACVQVGACHTQTTAKFICSNPSVSGLLSFADGVSKTMRELYDSIPIMNSADQTMQNIIKEQYAGKFHYIKSVSIFHSIVEEKDKIGQSYIDVPSFCASLSN